MPTITCADCGAERNARNRNTKYCVTCRLIRDLDFIGNSTNKCQSCSARFAPLKRSDTLCPDCDAFSKAIPARRETCRNCEGDQFKLLGDDIRMCLKCAGVPENRQGLMIRLHEKQQEAIDGRESDSQPDS